MTANETSFTKDKRPDTTRGKALKTKLFEVMRKESLLGVSDSASKEVIEEAFLKHWAERAFDKSNPESTMLLRELLNKCYQSLKPTLPAVDFDFDAELTPLQQVNQVITAASNGAIPPDIAGVFIQAVKYAHDIEETTTLRERMDRLEEALRG